MKEKILKGLASYRTALFLLVTYAGLMAAATAIEKVYSTPIAKGLVYYSPLFFLIQLLLCVSFVGISIRKHFFTLKKWHYLLLHAAFIVILIGAGITHFWGKEGLIHLREGEKSSVFWLKDSNLQSELPFELELEKFNLVRYQGSQSPSSYESFLKIETKEGAYEAKIYMNHVLDIEGFRLFQASYDEDEKGSILSVSYDSAGRTVTYAGYLLLFIGFIGCLLAPNSRFMLARKRLNKLSATLLTAAMLSLIPSETIFAGTVPPSHLKMFSHLPMQSISGRIMPVNTFADELLQKLEMHNKLSISADQWLLELITRSSEWVNEPIIPVNNKDIRNRYGWRNKRISYRDAFSDEGQYVMAEEIAAIFHKAPEKRNQYDKDMIKLDEQINIINQLFNCQLLRIFPLPKGEFNNRWVAPGEDLYSIMPKTADSIHRLFENYRKAVQNGFRNGNWKEADKSLRAIGSYQKKYGAEVIHEQKLKTEVKYNRYNLFPICKIIYFISGGLLLIITFYSWMSRKQRVGRKKIHLLGLFIIPGFLLHSYSIVLRWYISGYAPWSNSYETLVTTGWVAIAVGIIFLKRDTMTCALAVLFGGIALFVSDMSWMNPQITPLVPVLKSPWLLYHVASLMIAYGFFGICCLIGTVNLLLTGLQAHNPNISLQINRLTLINEMLQIIGLAFMGVGIFLGAIWANESWGRYWGWDPKETWAFISLIIYTLILHLHWFYPTTRHIRFNLLSQWGFLSILMTYFGVNCFLSGMHSYGNAYVWSERSAVILIPAVLFFSIPGALAYFKSRNRSKVKTALSDNHR